MNNLLRVEKRLKNRIKRPQIHIIMDKEVINNYSQIGEPCVRIMYVRKNKWLKFFSTKINLACITQAYNGGPLKVKSAIKNKKLNKIIQEVVDEVNSLILGSDHKVNNPSTKTEQDDKFELNGRL